jgi:hypothetical protein
MRRQAELSGERRSADEKLSDSGAGSHMLTPNWPDPNQTNFGGNNFEISATENNPDSNALGTTWPISQIEKLVWPTEKEATQIVTDC